MRHTFSTARIDTIDDTHQGLGANQVIERRSRYGVNAITDTPSSGWRGVILDTAKDPMVWFLLGFPLLYLPAHIVWLELIIHPTALRVFQQLPSSDNLDPVERQAKPRFFDAREWAVIALVGALLTGLTVSGFYYSLGVDMDVAHARSIAMIALIVGSVTVTAALSGLRTRTAIVTVFLSIASAVILVQVRPLAQLLHMSPLHGIDWAIVILGGLFAGSFAALIPLMRHWKSTSGASSRLSIDTITAHNRN